MWEPVIRRPLTERVLDALLRHEPMTAAEIAECLDLPDGRAVAGAMRTLDRQGRIRYVGERGRRPVWSHPRWSPPAA